MLAPRCPDFPPGRNSSAQVEFERDRIALHNGSATVGKISLGGSAGFPRSCDTDSPCEASFDLSSDELNPEQWNEVLNPHLKKTPWYYFWRTRAGSNALANLHASGHMASRRLTLGTVTGTAFATTFTFANGILELKNARADMFGGKVSGDWKIDFTGSEPSYECTGDAARIQAENWRLCSKLRLAPGSWACNTS